MESQQKIIARLTGPKQTMFRYADLQLQYLLESGLRIGNDIDEVLDRLPSTLNGTYDGILLRFRPSHQTIAKTALRSIAVAHQPLLVEELIEACTVKLEDGGQVCEELRLSPAQIISLLRNLVVFERSEDSTDLTSPAVCNKDYIVFAHFSVKEYLTTPEKMAQDVRNSFAIELKRAHLDVAGSCIAYLLRTNTLENREKAYPLCPYAWHLWALHAVLSTTDNTTETPNSAQDLFERIAFGDHYDIPGDLRRLIGWANPERAVLDCLGNPYFFEEYSALGLDLSDLTIYQRRSHIFKPLDVETDEIWLAQVVPNRNRSARVRWYHKTSKQVYVPYGSRTCRIDWLDDHICIDVTNAGELLNQFQLTSHIYTDAAPVTICLEDASDNEVWALEIMHLTEQLLIKHSNDTFSDLANLLRSQQSTDPFVWLKSLFQRSWWRDPWTFEEAVFGKIPILLYGIHALPLIRLQNFVSLAAQAFQLIINASQGPKRGPTILKDSVQ